jgi:Ca-activated chloride channel family protein
MTFGAPLYLWLLLLLPACGGALGGWLWWRRRARARFGGVHADSIASRIVLVLSPLLLLGAIALTVLAAARPQAGERTREVEDRGIDLVIVLDVSQSMLATDAPPSRIELAQREIDALLAALTGDRVGLVIFAGDTFVRSPLTSDLAAVRVLVAGVARERGFLQPGSDLGAGINDALDVLARGEAASKAILVVSDGEDHGESAATALARARSRDVRIYAAGVGSPDGAPVLDVDIATGASSPRIDDTGQIVLTRLEDQNLRALADASGARYLTLGDEPLLALASSFDELAATTFGTRESTRKVERFQVFAALALLLANLELLLLVVPRRPGASSIIRLWPIAASAIFVAGVCAKSAADVNEDANDTYARGDHEAALDLYRTAQAMDCGTAAPGCAAPELYYNAANALDQLQRFAEAIEEARAGCAGAAPACVHPECAPGAIPATPKPECTPADSALAAAVEYNLGNHFANAGRLLEALGAYRRALYADPGDDDAKHNYEVAARRLTPSPSPTIQIDLTPLITATPGDTGSAGGPGEEGGSTPAPDAGEGAQSTPGADSQVPQPQELSREELQRRLAEALAGIDLEFTPEEANRILDYLAEENRRSIEDATGDITRPAQPDY